MARDAVYVYAVVAAGGPLHLPEGIEGARSSLHECEGVAAIVSVVPDRPVQATRKNLQAHAAVLASALEQRDPVLPMRFGILMPDETALEADLLRAARPELEALLLERLSPLALNSRVRQELPERVAAKVSFLVERGRVEALEAEAELLAEECHPRLQLRLDGPLAPHSFVDLELPAGAVT